MAERISEDLRRALQFGPQPGVGEIGVGSTYLRTPWLRTSAEPGVSLNLPVDAPPPLPTRSAMEELFRLRAIEMSTDNNFFLSHGQVGDTGPTGGGMLGAQMGEIGCTSVGVGGDLKSYTEHDGVTGTGRAILGEHRDDEARLYASFGQQGACVQPIVDRLRAILPWAHITTASWGGRVGVGGTGNFGGLLFQQAIHEELSSGGTMEERNLAYRHGPRRIGLYTSLSGYAGSRLGDGPVSIGLRMTGEVAPAGTSRATAGFELQIQKNGFYVRLGFSGTVQQSSMSNFDGARLDGAYPTASGALGYQGDHGDSLEFVLAQNALGTGLGIPSLIDDKNLTASVMARITKAGFMDFLQKLRF